ncbi:MAG TPA: amidohydrolase family protein [Marmoricola sp.]|nr:amidohydrolase family protein [Marmoricola sp.]
MRAIRAAHAFDGTRFVPGGATVIVEGDRIVGVEAAARALPDSVEVTEYDGTVLPGLFDCHSHLVADGTLGALERVASMDDEAIDAVIGESLRAQAEAGVTTVRDLGDRGFRTLGFRDRPGMPRVVAAGPPLTTPRGHCHFLGGAVDGDLREAVAHHAERGVDVIKVMASGGFLTPGTDHLGAQFSVAELTAAVEAAHDRALPLVAHAHSLVGIQNALAAGVDGIEHFSGLTAEGPRIDDELLDKVAGRGTYIGVTLGIDRSANAGMAPPPQIERLLAGMGFTRFEAFVDACVGALRRLHQHGLTVVTGVDSGIAPTKRHGNAWRTVGELVEGGYPVAEALAAATSVAAEACGLAGTTGRLATGYAADLLVVDGDLAQDPSLLGAPREVVVRGTPVVAV